MPTRADIVRVVQCVEASAGASCRVTLSTSATVPAASEDLRPRPLAITPTPAVPFSMNRRRQRRTASESTPQRRAISSFATPSPAINKALACNTLRCGNEVERDNLPSSARSLSVTTRAGAATKVGTPTDYLVISQTDH